MVNGINWIEALDADGAAAELRRHGDLRDQAARTGDIEEAERLDLVLSALYRRQQEQLVA